MENKSDDEDLFNFPSPDNATPHPQFKVEEDEQKYDFSHLEHLNKKLFHEEKIIIEQSESDADLE